MSWSIRARLTVWYSAVVVTVLVAGAIAIAVVQGRLGLEHLDDGIDRLMLTLEGVMRNEFSEGLSLQEAADEASIEVIAPDRTLAIARPDGSLLAIWGQPLSSPWRPPTGMTPTLSTVEVDGIRLRHLSRSVEYEGHRYIASVLAPLSTLEKQQSELQAALTAGVVVALVVAALGGWVVGRQTLNPLRDMALQAESISARNPLAHLTSPNASDELGRLATSFNGLLDRLAAALNAQRQFMADASHELRTPVSIVRTTSQVTLSRNERTDDEYRESMTIIAEQAARLSRLVDSMFLLSRAEAQGVPLSREPVYLDDLVAETARALRIKATERGVGVAVPGDAEVGFVGDDGLLRQMVGNLLDNAIRHARAGGTVTATLQSCPDALVLRVTDDGEGVPPAEHERIFQRFVRLNSSNGGAGLGLPIARWIAEAHGGSLVLERSGPNGSCFLVSLPRV